MDLQQALQVHLAQAPFHAHQDFMPSQVLCQTTFQAQIFAQAVRWVKVHFLGAHQALLVQLLHQPAVPGSICQLQCVSTVRQGHIKTMLPLLAHHALNAKRVCMA